MSVLVTLGVLGCATRGNIDLLESQIRQADDNNRQLQAQLLAAQNELQTARVESTALRQQVQQAGHATLVAEQAEVLSKAEAIKFNSLLTSGVDTDGKTGDDALSVLVMPVDHDGELIKMPGDIEIELVDLSKPDNERRLGLWQFTVDQTREHWHRGFMAAGYLFNVDWQTAPSASDLVLHARMIAPDGRKFDATQKVAIKLSDAAAQVAKNSSAPTRTAKADSSLDKSPQATAFEPEKGATGRRRDRVQPAGFAEPQDSTESPTNREATPLRATGGSKKTGGTSRIPSAKDDDGELPAISSRRRISTNRISTVKPSGDLRDDSTDDGDTQDGPKNGPSVPMSDRWTMDELPVRR